MGSYYHTASGCDTGSNGFSFWTNTMNNTNRFPYFTIRVEKAFGISVQEIRLTTIENDPTDYTVAVEISPVNALTPTTGNQPGSGYTLLGTYSFAGGGGPKAIVLGSPLSLGTGTYHIRLRPTTTPAVSTSWMDVDNLVVIGTTSY